LKRAVFLDRDGVINKAFLRSGVPVPPSCLAELEILPGVFESLSSLRNANYLIIVVTNQPDVARLKANKENIEKMNSFLYSELPIDEIKTCYHDDIDMCACRKPKPGLILEAASTYDIDLSKSFMIGDRWRDIIAGKKAGCITFLIDYNYKEDIFFEPDYRIKSIYEAEKIITQEF
jgi:D-glycero-D-manno-heptose 1,7-bisphosphate phosphatase